MAKSEKAEKVEYEYGNSPWLPLLAMVTICFSVGLVTVTVIMYLDLHNLDETDARLTREIQSLQQKLESTRIDGPLPVSSIIEEETDADRRNVGTSDANRQHKRIAPTNFLEAIIQAQESIFEKYCHKLNSTCPSGALGTKGVKGDTGSLGLKGVPGPMGLKGGRGDPGPAGFKGPAGDKGIAGPRGLAGPQGLTGLKGLKGEPGPTGRPGTTGLPGSKGSKGPKGDIGLTGPRGLPGAHGLKGQKGDTGDTGYQGPKGDAGPQGIKGNDTEKLGDRCECIKQPTFADEVYSYSAHAQRSVEALCEATGNPTPDVTVMKVSDASPSEADATYECTATNMFGSATKYVKLRI